MKKPVGVTKDVLERFIREAKNAGISEDVADALQESLIENGNCTEKALLEAIFPENKP